MAYDNNVPLANQIVSQTQQPIHDNFADVDTLINVNHVGFNVANQGKHKFVTMPVQLVDPIPGAGDINLFSRTSAYTNAAELCLARETGDVIEMSANFNNGWAFTSSGLLIKWGTSNAVPSGVSAVAYTAAANIPVFAAVFTVIVTTAYPSATDENKNVTLVDFVNPAFFRVIGTQRTTTGVYAGNATIYYVALGRL